MKKQKVISAIVSVAAAFGGLGIVPVSAADEFKIADGYQFVDIAHSGDTYVALAKNSSGWDKAKLYTSIDGGSTWTSTRDISSAKVSANPQSQQQLVYWETEGIFVAHCAGATLTSSDGKAWINTKPLHLNNDGPNAVLSMSGEQLIVSYTNGITTVADAGSNVNDNLHAMSKISYPKAVAAKPADAEGNISVLIHNQNRLVDLTINETEGTYSYTDGNQSHNEVITSNPVDMVYADGAGQFLSIDGSEALFAAKSSQSYTKLSPKAGVGVTGIAANNEYIVIGMNDGTMYYTPNIELTAKTVWTQISGTADGPVKNIALDSDGDFIALDSTNIYKGDLSKFTRIDQYVEEYRDISAPYVTTDTQENPFEGVRLIGGAYSPKLDKYVVYGDTTEKLPNEDGVENYWGMIFTSDDGLTWERVYQGYTFTQRTMSKDDPNVVASYNEVRNGAVWWEREEIFIISASISDHSGDSLISEDGITWTHRADDDTGLRLNVDIAVGGDGNLYAGGSGKSVRKYTAWSTESMETINLKDKISGDWYLNQLSVSNEPDPAILTYQNAEGAIRDNTVTDGEEIEKWNINSNIQGSGRITDSVYSGNLNSFVAVATAGNRTTIINKGGSVTVGPVVSGGVICNAIDTNGEVFMLAGQDGNVYTAPDTAEFANSSLSAVASANGSANTMPLTNVFKAGEMFIATASDNTDSDVLAISKNSETGSYEYVTASSLIGPGEMAPGSTVNVCVDVDNQLNEVCTFTLISAVFSPDERCVQINTHDASVAARVKETVTMPVEIGADVPEGSTMRLFVWDSLEGMVPLTDVSVPFN